MNIFIVDDSQEQLDEQISLIRTLAPSAKIFG